MNPETPAAIKPRRRRWLRRVLWTVAILVTLGLLFHAEENWRGVRAWKHTREKLEGLGEPLRWEDRVKPAPDAENFFAAPIVQQRIMTESPVPWYRLKGSERLTGALRALGGDAAKKSGNEHLFDFAAAAKWLRDHSAETLPAPEGPTPAHDVLAFLRPAEPALEELHEALQRPSAVRGVEALRNVMLFTAREFLTLNALLVLRAQAAAEVGDLPTAREAWKDAILLAGKCISPPSSLIDQMVAGAVLSQAAESLTAACGKVADPEVLAEMQNQLGTANLLRAEIFRDERIYAMENFEKMIADGRAWMQQVNSPPPRLWFLVPNGWHRLHQSALAEHGQARIEAINARGWRNAIDVTTPVPWPQINWGQESFTTDGKPKPWGVFSSVMTSLLNVQTRLNATRIALAAAAYRLRHGGPPQTLTELSGSFPNGQAPLDLWTDQPFGYEVDADGSFRIIPSRDDEGGVKVAALRLTQLRKEN